IASVIAGCSTHPLDLIKVRMQLQGENTQKPNIPNIRPALAFQHGYVRPSQSSAATAMPRVGPISVGVKLVQQEGVTALFSGVS
ncbi:mitochondrial-like uncoupling protein 5-like, partial [Trifolium medium]|nr:mitochondrial-like uncoupling protein 5-like [Trifolium medium]